uniref:Tify domain-containing protein n=1 Tax=Kalanchoe fedtschenkoi TaxID=63787 RepID=A0A7N0UYC6_KALFE
MADSGKQNPDSSNAVSEGLGDQTKKLYRLAAMQRLKEKRAARAAKIAAAGAKSEAEEAAARDQRPSKARKTSDVQEEPARRRLAISENKGTEKKVRIKAEKQIRKEEKPPLPAQPAMKTLDEKGDGIMVPGSSSSGNTSRSSKRQQANPDLQANAPPPAPAPAPASRPRSRPGPVLNRRHVPNNYLLALPVAQKPSRIPVVLLPNESGQPAPTSTLQLFPEGPPALPQHERCIPAYGMNTKRGVVVIKPDGQRVTGYMLRCFSVQDIVLSCDCHNKMYSPEGFMKHAGLEGQYSGSPLQHIKVLKKG